MQAKHSRNRYCWAESCQAVNTLTVNGCLRMCTCTAFKSTSFTSALIADSPTLVTYISSVDLANAVAAKSQQALESAIQSIDKELANSPNANVMAEADPLTGSPPWIIHPSTSEAAPLEHALKKHIMDLSKDPRNFLLPPPSAGTDGDGQSVFDFTDYQSTAAGALRYDANLATLRFELVPKLISETDFWKNYFYRVSLIRASLHLNPNFPTMSSSRPTSAMSQPATANTAYKQNTNELLFDAPSEEDAGSEELLPADWEKDLQAELDGVDGLDAVEAPGSIVEDVGHDHVEKAEIGTSD
ncbi:hypothetical protein SeLEV6574_g05781 [Synchytrium endobioticum]|uniref:BSD domain-containing protein n=1 Tax=Synchytrium endobioticum TaxID=286115 RepID=A0A507CSC8_9FUNG|nr:hypothetical protein SeLEV6574_g05781 [Synchytrium endobioticum]